MRIVDAMMDGFFELPLWARWVLAILAIMSVDALFLAWGERRPVAAFAESLVAVTAYWATGLGSIALGIWGGVTAAKKTGRTWIGWIAGIAIMFLAGFSRLLVKEIPGIGWRIEKIEEAREDALTDSF